MNLMKFLALFFVLFFSINNVFASEILFSKALETCQSYSRTGSIKKDGEIFNLKITLEKTKNRCVYKEKIYQNDSYSLLTCEFIEEQLPFMHESMERFYKAYPKEIAKNKIYEAKLTTNGEIFNKYLANPKYCKITTSKN